MRHKLVFRRCQNVQCSACAHVLLPILIFITTSFMLDCCKNNFGPFSLGFACLKAALIPRKTVEHSAGVSTENVWAWMVVRQRECSVDPCLFGDPATRSVVLPFAVRGLALRKYALSEVLSCFRLVAATLCSICILVQGVLPLKTRASNGSSIIDLLYPVCHP